MFPLIVDRRACWAPRGCPPTATSTPRSSPTPSPTARGAAAAAVFTNTRVIGIDVDHGRVRGVRTERGDIEAEIVVNAGGMFAAEIGRMAGVRMPIVPMAHEYLVTQPFRDRDGGNLPTLRDPDLLIYYREEGGGLVMGGYERHCAPWSLTEDGVGYDAIPPDFNGRLLEEDWDRFEEIVENSKRRVPAMEDVKVTRLINGPEAFTPDGEFCLGETEVRGYFVAAGFCAHGLAGAGGIGKVDGRVDRRAVSRASTSGTWTSGASARSTARPDTRSSARRRSTRPTTTSSTRGTNASRGGRCGCRRRCRGTPGTTPRSGRSRAGSA